MKSSDLALGCRATAAVERVDARARVLARDLLRTLQHHSLGVEAIDPTGARGRILVADMQVPQPNNNAGDRNIVDFMRTLIESGWSVSFWPRDLRADPRDVDPLSRLGVEVIAGYRRPTLSAWLRARGENLRHALLCRPMIAAAYLPVIRRHTGVPITYYGHDLHFARLKMEADVLARPATLRKAARIEATERWVWRKSDAVIYPTAEEAAEVRRVQPDTAAYAMPIFRFDKFLRRATQPKAKNVVFVGGFGHPPNLDAANWLVSEIWPTVTSAEPNARLFIVGSNPPVPIQNLTSSTIFVTGAISHEALSELYNEARVAAVPLRFGAGMKLKVVEALAFGTPLATTSVGAQGLDGLELVAQPKNQNFAFAAEIIRLLRLNASAWLSQSDLQISYATSRFDGTVMSASLETVLASATSAKERQRF